MQAGMQLNMTSQAFLQVFIRIDKVTQKQILNFPSFQGVEIIAEILCGV